MKKTLKLAFTLIELLVVVSIIGMLAGLLLPAVQSAREAGRRAVCINNQKNIALAFNNYQSARNKFPQYVNQVRADRGNYSVSRTVSWLPILLPYLDSVQIWDHYTRIGESDLTLPFMHCKSKGTQATGEVCYVANCGYNDGPHGARFADSAAAHNDQKYLCGDSSRFNGVLNNGGGGWFADSSWSNAKADGAVAIDDIVDGSTNTLLVSENMQAGKFLKKNTDDGWPVWEFHVGFCWSFPTNANRSVTWTGTGAFVNYLGTLPCATTWSGATSVSGLSSEPSWWFTTSGISYSHLNGPMPINRCAMDFDTSRAWMTARPSSFHPGVVVAAMVDGSVRVLSDQVNEEVYIRAMTPNDKKCFWTDINSGILDISKLSD